MLVRLGRTITVADMMKKVKASSSIWMKPRQPAFAWQQGYGAFSIAEDAIGVVVHYIETQEEHHRKVTFQEEYLQILREHGLEWDERFIWE